MAVENPADPEIARVTEALGEWRQGDCVLGEQWFAFRAGSDFAVTLEAQAALEADVDLVEVSVPGFVVVTQTCDIVRSCAERPFVEVSPLVSVSDEHLREIEKARRPAYGYLPALARHNLVADLDRVMTVEKPLVATWAREPGWATDAEGRAFAKALSRKRQRFAFPNDFNRLAGTLRRRMEKKHDKDSPEGRALRALKEIRVRAEPSWDADQISLFIWFVRAQDEEDFQGQSWDEFVEKWLEMMPCGGRFISVDGIVFTLADMSGQDYVESDPLDLDNLSDASRR